MTSSQDGKVGSWSRRNFLQTVGAGVPTLSMALTNPSNLAADDPAAFNPNKFTPIDLSPYFNASAQDFGPRDRARLLSGDSANDGLVRMPSGKQILRGMPFLLGSAETNRKSWAATSLRSSSWTSSQFEVPIGKSATFICLASFCDWDSHENPPPGSDVTERVGQRLANLNIVYAEGTESPLPLRRRFEVHQPSMGWGHMAYLSEPHLFHVPIHLSDPLRNAYDWGRLQFTARDNCYPLDPDGRPIAILWVSEIACPKPQVIIKSLRIEAAAEDPMLICGLTLFHGQESPMRLDRLTLYRIALPEPTAEDAGRWQVSLDLGIVARTITPSQFEAESWLTAPHAGLGEIAKPTEGGKYIYTQISASPEATLTLLDRKSGQRYNFELKSARPGEEHATFPAGAQVRVLETEKVWVCGRVLDGSTHQQTPVRIAFLSKEGRYIPPYGHRTEINDGWFQDYGADVKLMDASFAYIDGSFLTFATTGPLLLFKAEGRSPGEEIALASGGGAIEIEAVGRGHVPFHRIEIVLNGKVVASKDDPAGTREMVLRDKIKVVAPGWLAARCSSQLGPSTSWHLAIAAHTSPVYLTTPGKELFSPSAATYTLTLIDGAQGWVENLASRPDAETYERIRRTFIDARERLHRRFHEHGIPH